MHFQDRYEAKTKQNEDSTALVEPRTARKRYVFDGSSGAPPNDFRSLSLIPTLEDIDINQAVYLRPAKIKGQYDSDEHYLDVQFRLLREDLIRPLREGIAAYTKQGPRKSEIFVYRNVGLEPAIMHQQTGELIFYAQIEVSF